jgi:hypothetical protein
MKKLILLSFFSLLVATTAYSQNFEINWQQCFGGSKEERAMDIISVETGYYIAGWTESTDGDVSFNHGSGDAWIIKTDIEGNILWEKTYGGTAGEFWRRIISAPDNNFYLLGASGSGNGDISYDPYPGSNDLWIAKIDNLGNLIWEKIIGGGMIDMVESGTSTNDGGVVVFGWTGSQNGDVSVNYGIYDMWMVKFNSDGDIEWDKSFGTNDFDYGNVIIQTSDGGFLVGGTSTIGTGGNLTCIPHSINAEAIILKLNSTGEIEWQNCYGGSEHDGVFGLLELNDGYLISAYADSNDGDVTGHHGESDIWIIKIDFYGNIIWEHCYGGNNMEIAYNIFEESNGDYLVIGSTSSNDGDVSGNHSISEYYEDIWVFRVNNNGGLLWQHCYGGEGSEGNIRFNSIRKNVNNYIIPTISDLGPSYNVQCTPHGGIGDEDWWVFEIKDTTVGIPQTMANQSLKTYPNPANNYVIFEINNPVILNASGGMRDSADEESPQYNSQQPLLTVTNTLGQQIAQLEIKDTKTVWDTRQVYSGVYFYRVAIEDIHYSGKVVVQR